MTAPLQSKPHRPIPAPHTPDARPAFDPAGNLPDKRAAAIIGGTQETAGSDMKNIRDFALILAIAAGIGAVVNWWHPASVDRALQACATPIPANESLPWLKEERERDLARCWRYWTEGSPDIAERRAPAVGAGFVPADIRVTQ